MAPRKRVRAIQRATDGSAFKRCDDCGILVAIALADMHQCEDSKTTQVKKLKSIDPSGNVVEQCFSDQPRSAFRFFMESFAKNKNGILDELEIDREGFELWKVMSFEERQTYILEAEKVNSAYAKRTEQEIDDFREVYYETDSGDVGNFNKSYENYECSYSTDCDDWLCLDKWVESLDTCEW